MRLNISWLTVIDGFHWVLTCIAHLHRVVFHSAKAPKTKVIWPSLPVKHLLVFSPRSIRLIVLLKRRLRRCERAGESSRYHAHMPGFAQFRHSLLIHKFPVGWVLGSIPGVRSLPVGILELHALTSTCSLMTSEAALDGGFMTKTVKGGFG